MKEKIIIALVSLFLFGCADENKITNNCSVLVSIQEFNKRQQNENLDPIAFHDTNGDGAVDSVEIEVNAEVCSFTSNETGPTTNTTSDIDTTISPEVL